MIVMLSFRVFIIFSISLEVLKGIFNFVFDDAFVLKGGNFTYFKLC